MTLPSEAEFGIEISFEKCSSNPSRIFRSMYELIEACQSIDSSLVRSIDVNLETILVLEDIETGSIKSWLRAVINTVDDDALKNINWRPLIGQYLVKGKHKIISFLQDKPGIADVKELETLETDLYSLAEQTDVKWLPAFAPVNRRELLENIRLLSSGLAHLQKEDTASYIIPSESLPFNLDFRLESDSIEDLLRNDALISESELLLQVKKPDYLGESMWEFRHAKRNILVKITDKAWLERFQSRQVDIRPGDALKAAVRITYDRDINGKLTDAHYELVKVIRPIYLADRKQTTFLNGHNEENT